MNQNEPMTPSYSWLKKVNDNVFKTEGGENMRRVKNLFHEIRPAVIVTPWYKEGRFYYAMMRLFVGEDRKISDEKYKVYAPQLGDASSPNTTHPEDFSSRILYVIWRGRWEALEVRPIVYPYVAKEGISIGICNSTDGGIPISNIGVTNAQIYGDDTKNTLTLYFSSRWFRWSKVNEAGCPEREKSAICIRTKIIDVVTKPPEINVSYGMAQFFIGNDSLGNPKYEYRQVVTGVNITEATVEKVLVLAGDE